ncbi:MAG: DUF2142 domain-containing protein [Candidatus Eisenbacteria bacterium]|jgi:hypothetical protein|nr:DUF2142 domain-containing protein [Candidatus Eisenbacteria bacterium]
MIKMMWIPIVLFGLLRGVWCALIIPPWQGPDEPMHFALAASSAAGTMSDEQRVRMEGEVIRSMAHYRFWELTGQVEPDPLPSIIRSSAGIPAPTLYHRILGVWLRAAGLPAPDGTWPGSAETGALVRSGRMLSVCMHGCAAALLWWASMLISGSPPFAVLTSLLFLAHPQMTFIGACLNSDNLLVLLAGLTVFLMSRALVNERRWARGLLLLLCVVAPVAKRAGLAITLTALPVAVLPELRDRRRVLRAAGAALAVIAMAAGGLWLAGMGRSMLVDIKEVLGVGGWVGERPHGWWRTFASHFWDTFWGSYGWVQCTLPAWCLRVIGVLTATALVMAPVGVRRLPSRRGLGLMLLISAVQVVLAVGQVVIAQGMRNELGQGRHAFVCLPGLSLLMAAGVRGLAPPAREAWLPAVGLVAVVLGEAVIWFVAVPCFLR